MRVLLLCVAFGLQLSAQAGTIYKCTEGGRTTYGDRPCKGSGATLAVQPAPPPDPAFEARQERARALVGAIDARRAEQAAHDDALARDAARRQQQQTQDKARYCTQLRLRQQAAAEQDGRAIAIARRENKGFMEQRARYNDRQRASEMAAQCPS